MPLMAMLRMARRLERSDLVQVVSARAPSTSTSPPSVRSPRRWSSTLAELPRAGSGLSDD